MKPDKKPEKAGNQHGIALDDHIYFHHDEQGVHSGRVAAVGEHGCLVEHELAGDEKHLPVKWDKVLGYKQRKQKKIQIVDRGEDGSIGMDEEGKRIFIAGQIPEDDLAKSLPAQFNPQVVQAQIDAALLQAGYDPGEEYIKSHYGAHWSKQVGRG